MAKQSRGKGFLKTDAGPLGSFLAILTGIFVLLTLDHLLGDYLRQIVSPGIETVLFSAIGVVIGMVVYIAVAKVRTSHGSDQQ